MKKDRFENILAEELLADYLLLRKQLYETAPEHITEDLCKQKNGTIHADELIAIYFLYEISFIIFIHNSYKNYKKYLYEHNFINPEYNLYDQQNFIRDAYNLWLDKKLIPNILLRNFYFDNDDIDWGVFDYYIRNINYPKYVYEVYNEFSVNKRRSSYIISKIIQRMQSSDIFYYLYMLFFSLNSMFIANKIIKIKPKDVYYYEGNIDEINKEIYKYTLRFYETIRKITENILINIDDLVKNKKIQRYVEKFKEKVLMLK